MSLKPSASEFGRSTLTEGLVIRSVALRDCLGSLQRVTWVTRTAGQPGSDRDRH